MSAQASPPPVPLSLQLAAIRRFYRMADERVADEKPETPVDDNVSPYLQRPLRTLEEAREDRKRRQRQIADARARQPR